MSKGLFQARDLIQISQTLQFPVLYLDSCDIEDLNDLPELFECLYLTQLSIRSNKISDISRLAELTNLKSLKLNSNRISDISCLEKLTELEALNLSSNQISDISCLEKLIKLETLSLSYNKISDIGCLGELDELISLDLASNKISDISSLEGLDELNSLDLASNLISDISCLGKLTKLETLSLNSNQISEIIYLRKLAKLRNLDLSSNKIKEIPRGIIKLNLDINLSTNIFGADGLYLNNNPLESPPIEILVGEHSSILDWYKAKKKKLNEIKIILIGDPKSGKTSLLRRLKNDKFDDNEIQTDGVNIEDIHFGSCETFKNQTALHNLTGHFWDFGGQEIMNATHQFFLTNRSLYILMLDARKDTNVSGQIRQWVKRIKVSSGNSSIIVIANQIDVNASFGFENEYELQSEFPQIKYFIKVSCKTLENISVLKEKLEELTPKSEILETEIDERWFSLKEQLQKDTRKNYYLNENLFLDTCKKINLKKKTEQRDAIKFLHDLGLVLHFENITLSEYFVLDPYWITYGVYQILTSSYVSNNKGFVNMTNLEYIVNEELDKQGQYSPTNYKKIIYSNNDRRFLVDILNQFKLCFYLPNHLSFIIPDLLETNEPNEITEPIRNSNESIRFVYEYEYLLKSIMPFIMVETHLMIFAKWRTGCVLKYDGCECLISSYQNRITIIVTGEHKKKREYMAVIRHIIDLINKNLNDKPKMLIPLPEIDGFADYEELLDREKDGEKQLTIYKPKKMKFEISLLIEGIPTFNEVKEIRDILDKVLANEENILDSVEKIIDSQEEIKLLLDSHYQYIINQPENSNINDELLASIKDISENQTKQITQETMLWIANAFDLLEDDMDEKLKDLCTDIKKTDDLKLKLKLSVPLINLIGVKFESEFDLKSWYSTMYAKHKLNIFRLMGTI